MKSYPSFVLLVTLASTSLAAQPSTIPKTTSGLPDFNGVWYYGSATPFERPIALGTQKTYTEAEAAAIVSRLEQFVEDRLMASDPNRSAPEAGAEVGQEADANFAAARTNLTKVDGLYRTSLIVDPPDGRLPYRAGGQDIFDEWRAAGIGEFDGPEVRPASERCLSTVGPIAPMVGWRYNANMRIVQTEDYLVIKGEMLAPRIIALKNQLPRRNFVRWMGESLAHWEGRTLVIETTNFRPEVSWFRLKTSDQLKVTERLELVAPGEILYRYTLEDPKIYSAPYTVEMSVSRRAAGERLFEYACHEANYSLGAILRGARLAESEARGN